MRRSIASLLRSVASRLDPPAPVTWMNAGSHATSTTYPGTSITWGI